MAEEVGRCLEPGLGRVSRKPCYDTGETARRGKCHIRTRKLNHIDIHARPLVFVAGTNHAYRY